MDKKTFFILLLFWIILIFLFFGMGGFQKDAHLFPGFPLDDSWIHLTFAKNLGDYGTFGLNRNEPSCGATSPLWVLLLTFFYKITHHMIPFAWMLGSLFVFLTSLMIYRLAFLLTEDKILSFFAAVFSLMTGRFLWGGLSGMEVSLFAFLMAASIYVHERARRQNQISLLSSVLFGLTSLARPEGYLLFLFAFLQLFLENRPFFKKNTSRLFIYVCLYLIFSMPYIIYCLFLTARPFCSSYYSKMSFTWKLRFFDYLKGYSKVLFFDNPILFIFLPLGFLELFKRKQYLLTAWLLGFPFIAAFKAPILIHHARYNMPFIPLYVLVSLVGFKRIITKKFIAIVFGAMALVVSMVGFIVWSQRFTTDAASIENQHVRVAFWLRQHVGKNEAVATNDIGAISYFSERRVVDLAGIINSDILKILRSRMSDQKRREFLRTYLLKRDVRYMAFYKEWFPWLVPDPALKKVFAATLKNNTIAGSDTMEVYKIQ